MVADPLVHSLLAIDCGNTRLKWGLRSDDGWMRTGSAEASTLAPLLAGDTLLPKSPQAIASNVAGPTVEAALTGWASRHGVALRFIRPEARRLGVTNGYADPAQLGSDRWAALVAAHALEAVDLLVVNAGTALTVDALTSQGEFLGGLIVPGPALMRRSLSQGTAGLPLAPGAFAAFPVRTADAIASGAIQACIGAIERTAAAMARRGAAPRRIILSGGAALELRDHLPLEHSFHEHLVLEGLVLLARDP
jgi:type III pantothenate kinase